LFFPNSDAALFEASNCMGAGVVMHDHTCLAACWQHIDGLQTPEYAGALALCRAVQLALDHGRTRAIFASDCLPLVQRLDSGSLDRSSIGLVVSSIKHMVKDFASVSFCHVKRVLNEAAHLLARSCENVNSSCVFISALDLIRGILCFDVI
jgi:hypothetical protein